MEPASFIHKLTQPTFKEETALQEGRWLVLLYATWSQPDMMCVHIARATVQRLAGAICLGLRPFDEYEELRAWCPAIEADWKSPLWLLVREGQIVREFAYPQTREQLEAILQTFI